ncbi:hypothetical protein BLA60_27985 [Actinophytocola xinjiangensis]|uniref:SMP-30/Gluconolactonase/LRE-like region domain-containing protein n=1 Tax=Actinophytocola xinjiangensis TaxID=485602 RepID=A0A7Z1AVL5_9PSEU|nr:SMP-30/gluconolactonase/LRE family protein [Actinophytocola xinjiangensis]OLF07403.1 hypothetical protein BLA60_27985 [Actinophytocola xinjiangensis]
MITAERVSVARAELGESPLWDTGVGLRWLDVPGRALHTIGLDGGESVVALPETVSAVEPTTGATLLAVTATGFALLDPDTGALTPFAAAVSQDGVAMNDAAVDPSGRCWAGSAVRDDSFRGALYRLDEHSVTMCEGGLGMSNGIDWSPSGTVMYHVDSAVGELRAHAYDPATGDLGGRRVLRTVPATVGLPDGLTVARDGGVWLAVWGAGQVWRLDPDTGETTEIVAVPTPHPTSCAFGGPDLGTLHVTTARPGGHVYAADVPAVGRLPHRFAGAGR